MIRQRVFSPPHVDQINSLAASLPVAGGPYKSTTFAPVFAQLAIDEDVRRIGRLSFRILTLSSGGMTPNIRVCGDGCQKSCTLVFGGIICGSQLGLGGYVTMLENCGSATTEIDYIINHYIYQREINIERGDVLGE